MAKYYETILRYEKMQDNGSVKKVAEHFLSDSLSLTEAETTVTEKMQPYISGKFVATSAKETKIAEVVGDKEAGKFFLAKVAFITIDEKTAAEKKAISRILVGAEDFERAYNNLKVAMLTTMADWELQSLAVSPIIDVFTH